MSSSFILNIAWNWESLEEDSVFFVIEKVVSGLLSMAEIFGFTLSHDFLEALFNGKRFYWTSSHLYSFPLLVKELPAGQEILGEILK
jgi:hypothetical protein